MPAPKHAPILRARIDRGRVAWLGIDGKKWDAAKRHLEGAEVEITIRKRPKRRSLNQNAYYHGVVVALLAEAAGYDAEEMHEALKWQFLRNHENTLLPTVRSTTELTTVEMEEYLEKCRRLAAETYGMYVPEPNEVEMTV